MADFTIPTVDLSCFFEGPSDENMQKKEEAMEVIRRSCSEVGFFQIVNHGVPVELMSRAIELLRSYFECTDEEKLRLSPGCRPRLASGYNKQPDNSHDKNEYLMIFPPGSNLSVYPDNPPEFREVLEQVFGYMVKTCSLMEDILNECLGFPPNFLKDYNSDPNWDFVVAHRYFQAKENDYIGIGVAEHEDATCFTFVFQDEVGGLEVLKDGEWIPVVPKKGHIVVNLGDLIQVMSNNKFKSATHRVLRPKNQSRYSYAFFHGPPGDKVVEPLPQFTSDIGDLPQYRPFVFNEYAQMRIRNKTHPPSRPEDMINITHFAIPTPP